MGRAGRWELLCSCCAALCFPKGLKRCRLEIPLTERLEGFGALRAPYGLYGAGGVCLLAAVSSNSCRALLEGEPAALLLPIRLCVLPGENPKTRCPRSTGLCWASAAPHLAVLLRVGWRWECWQRAACPLLCVPYLLALMLAQGHTQLLSRLARHEATHTVWEQILLSTPVRLWYGDAASPGVYHSLNITTKAGSCSWLGKHLGPAWGNGLLLL